MISQKPWQSYRKVATQTATPAHLVLMMYDGILGFLERSLVGFSLTDIQLRNQTISNNLIRAQAIIRELDVHLDMEKGAEVALNFHQLYGYHYRRLGEANRNKTREPIDEVMQLVRVLRDSWSEMLQRGPDNPPEYMPEPPMPAILQSES